MHCLAKSALLVVLSCFMFWAEVYAETAQTRPLKCATTHYPPFTDFSNDPVNPTGFDIEIVNALAKAFNWSITIDNVPWQRLLNNLHLNTYDCYFSMGKLGDRADHVVFTETPLHITRYAVFTLAGRNKTDIKTYATLRGIPAPRLLHEKYDLRNAHEVKANDNQLLVKLLLKGRVDAFVSNSEVGLYVARKMGASDNISRQVFHEYDLPTYLVFSKTVKDIDIDVVNTWLANHVRLHPHK